MTLFTAKLAQEIAKEAIAPTNHRIQDSIKRILKLIEEAARAGRHEVYFKVEDVSCDYQLGNQQMETIINILTSEPYNFIIQYSNYAYVISW